MWFSWIQKCTHTHCCLKCHIPRHLASVWTTSGFMSRRLSLSQRDPTEQLSLWGHGSHLRVCPEVCVCVCVCMYLGEGHTAKTKPLPLLIPPLWLNQVSQCCSLGCWPSPGGGSAVCICVCVVVVCVCVEGRRWMRRKGVIIGHKPRHGDNTPHTQKTAQTQLGCLPRTPEQHSTLLCVRVCVCAQACFGCLPTKESPVRLYKNVSYSKSLMFKRKVTT